MSYLLVAVFLSLLSQLYVFFFFFKNSCVIFPSFAFNVAVVSAPPPFFFCNRDWSSDLLPLFEFCAQEAQEGLRACYKSFSEQPTDPEEIRRRANADPEIQVR